MPIYYWKAMGGWVVVVVGFSLLVVSLLNHMDFVCPFILLGGILDCSLMKERHFNYITFFYIVNPSSIIEPKSVLIYSTLFQSLFSQKSVFDPVAPFKLCSVHRHSKICPAKEALTWNEHSTSLKMQLWILTGLHKDAWSYTAGSKLWTKVTLTSFVETLIILHIS